MLTHLIAMGLFDAEIEAGTGAVIATPERTVIVPKTPGALAWAAHLDPSDRAPFAFDWQALVPDNEKIAEIVRLTVSATGAAAGVEIDDSADRLPIIDTLGKKIQIWFLVDPAFQSNAAFLNGGLQVGISALIRTDSDPFNDFERTAVLTVRQQ